MSLNQFFFPLQGLHHASHLWAKAERFALALVAMSFILIKKLLLLLSGDVETNPGPSGQHSEGTESVVIAAYLYALFRAVKETQWDRFLEKGPSACFFCLKCPLYIPSYAGKSVMEL